jgi:hypothetical protein
LTDRAALLDVVEAQVADLPDVAVAVSEASTTWSRSGMAFAVLGTDWIELRIGPAVAAAAARTPDTTASARGPEWISFAPVELDGYAVDRLGAWFGLAYRRARG